MSKPRYRDFGEYKAEFSAVLQGLDKRTPKDPTIVPKQIVEQKAAPAPAKAKPRVLAEAARYSKYSSPEKAMDSFRVLAGLEDRQMMPWNPGIVGETRSVSTLMEAFGMNEDGGSSDDEHDQAVAKKMANYDAIQRRPNPKPDMGGFSPKAAHKALQHSQRTMATAHAKHSYMHQLEPHEQALTKRELGKLNMHSSHLLRGAADGAPADVHRELHALADKHETHARIYHKGGRPKLEAIEEAQDFAYNIDIFTE